MFVGMIKYITNRVIHDDSCLCITPYNVIFKSTCNFQQRFFNSPLSFYQK